MANVDHPFGFMPLMRSVVGGPGAGLLPAEKIAGSNTALFVHDVVKLAGSGTDTGVVAIAAGTAGAAAYGVNLGPYGAADTKTSHTIIPGHLQLFVAQIDTVAVGTQNQNCQLVATAGDSTTLLSKHSLNNLATTNTHEFKVISIYRAIDNAAGAYARVIVTFNESQLSDQVAGV